jgi:sarcosine oxidase, subunit beta
MPTTSTEVGEPPRKTRPTGRLTFFSSTLAPSVTHGPGLGRLMAEVIHAGGSDWVDASRYRLDRFEPGAFPDEKAVAAAMPARRLADDHASSD